MKEWNPFQHLQLFTWAVSQPLWDIILGKSALISNQRGIILWWGKTTLSLKARGTIDQENSPVCYNACMQTLWKHWNTHMGSALPSILCLTVSMSWLKILRHASTFPHTFLGLILLTIYICKSLKESSTWRFGCRIHGPWYQSWFLPRQDTLHVLSSYLQQHNLICSLGTELDLTAAYLNSSVQQKSIDLFAVGLVS